MEPITSFGYWVRRQRKALDLTQATLAQQVGCALVTVKKIERDERRPSREMAELLANHLAIAETDRDKFIKMARGQWVDDAVAPNAPLEPPTAPSPTQHDLPPQPTSFVGREAELARLKTLLADPDKRLATILGPGGIGKTRLCLAAAEAQIASDRFTDGVSFIPLASVYERLALVQAIADATGLSISQSPQPEQILLNQLSDRRMLIVLDNFEQLRAEANLIERILAVAPGIKLLVSSRERLNLGHEWIIDLHGLPTPGDMTVADGAAARLFVQRAQQVRAEFELSGNEAAVSRICQLVEGMPLGLELAANWIRAMKAVEIASEVKRSIDFLTTGQRNIPDRHRSMRAVFQSTWAQLPAEEQWIFSRLSVFRNGFTYDAAAAVTGATPTTLLSLIDSSLLRRDKRGRYAIHELLRQFANEQLIDSERADSVRWHHATYFLTLAEKLEEARDTPAVLTWLRRLQREMDNLRAANKWAIEEQDAEFVHRFSGALLALWTYGDNHVEANQWFGLALALEAGERTPAALQAEADALQSAGHTAALQDACDLGHARFKRELALRMEIGEPVGIAGALRGLGFTDMIWGNLVIAQQYTEKALTISRAERDIHGIIWARYDLAQIRLQLREFIAAERQLELVMRQLREHELPFGVYRATLALGAVKRELGNTTEARAFYIEGLMLQQETPFVSWAVDGIEGLAGIAADEGEVVRAVHLLAAAESHRVETFSPRWGLQKERYAADLAYTRTLIDEDAWDVAWADGQGIAFDDMVRYAIGDPASISANSTSVVQK